MNIYRFKPELSFEKQSLYFEAEGFADAFDKCTKLVDTFHAKDKAAHLEGKKQNELAQSVWDERKKNKEIRDGEKRPTWDWKEPEDIDDMYQKVSIEFVGKKEDV